MSNFEEEFPSTFLYPDFKETNVIQSLGHATLYVLDQKKAYDVYVNKFGFKVAMDMEMNGGLRWLTVSTPAQPDLAILLAEPKAPMIEPELIPHFLAILNADASGGGVWETDNCEATYKDLKAKGIVFTKEPKQEFYGIEALFLDGCGNWFSLVQRPKKEARQGS